MTKPPIRRTMDILATVIERDVIAPSLLRALNSEDGLDTIHGTIWLAGDRLLGEQTGATDDEPIQVAIIGFRA